MMLLRAATALLACRATSAATSSDVETSASTAGATEVASKLTAPIAAESDAQSSQSCTNNRCCDDGDCGSDQICSLEFPISCQCYDIRYTSFFTLPGYNYGHCQNVSPPVSAGGRCRLDGQCASGHCYDWFWGTDTCTCRQDSHCESGYYCHKGYGWAGVPEGHGFCVRCPYCLFNADCTVCENDMDKLFCGRDDADVQAECNAATFDPTTRDLEWPSCTGCTQYGYPGHGTSANGYNPYCVSGRGVWPSTCGTKCAHYWGCYDEVCDRYVQADYEYDGTPCNPSGGGANDQGDEAVDVQEVILPPAHAAANDGIVAQEETHQEHEELSGEKLEAALSQNATGLEKAQRELKEGGQPAHTIWEYFKLHAKIDAHGLCGKTKAQQEAEIKKYFRDNAIEPGVKFEEVTIVGDPCPSSSGEEDEEGNAAEQQRRKLEALGTDYTFKAYISGTCKRCLTLGLPGAHSLNGAAVEVQKAMPNLHLRSSSSATTSSATFTGVSEVVKDHSQSGTVTKNTWYDSYGPTYDCDWYEASSSRCSWFGHNYRNFGVTANEICPMCYWPSCSGCTAQGYPGHPTSANGYNPYCIGSVNPSTCGTKCAHYWGCWDEACNRYVSADYTYGGPDCVDAVTDESEGRDPSFWLNGVELTSEEFAAARLHNSTAADKHSSTKKFLRASSLPLFLEEETLTPVGGTNNTSTCSTDDDCDHADAKCNPCGYAATVCLPVNQAHGELCECNAMCRSGVCDDSVEPRTCTAPTE